MSKAFSTELTSLDDTEVLGTALAKGIADVWAEGFILYLKGDLGAGKTTLSRFVIQNLGHNGNVKSPTYTLVEPYELADGHINHFDLYRLGDPEELEYMGMRDYFSKNTLSIIEWPERGGHLLAQPDLVITLSYDSKRHVSVHALSASGETVVNVCQQQLGNNN